MDNELKRVLIEKKLRESSIERSKREHESGLRSGDEIEGLRVDHLRDSALSAEAYVRHVSKLKRGK